jgi:hypothetical protein
MATHPHNRPHSVDESTAEFLYLIYEVLFKAEGLSLRTKQRTFETAADSKNSWRVVSISEAALAHLKQTQSATGLQRGHIVSRVDRAKALFERPAPMSRHELLTYFFEHDTVALVTKAENAKAGVAHWSKLRAVPEGLFTAGSFSIYVRKGKELPWVRDQS